MLDTSLPSVYCSAVRYFHAGYLTAICLLQCCYVFAGCHCNVPWIHLSASQLSVWLSDAAVVSWWSIVDKPSPLTVLVWLVRCLHILSHSCFVKAMRWGVHHWKRIFLWPSLLTIFAEGSHFLWNFGMILHFFRKLSDLIPIQASRLQATDESQSAMGFTGHSAEVVILALFAPKWGFLAQFSKNWGHFFRFSEGGWDLSLQSLQGCSVRDSGGCWKILKGKSFSLTSSTKGLSLKVTTHSLQAVQVSPILIQWTLWSVLEGLTDVKYSFPYRGSLHKQGEEDLERGILPTLPCIWTQAVRSIRSVPPILRLVSLSQREQGINLGVAVRLQGFLW